MSLLARAELPPDYPPFRAFQARLGFVPDVFPAQSLLPRAVEAETALIRAILLAPGALPWARREEIVVAVSASRRNRHCVGLHAHILRSLGCADAEVAAIAGGRFDAFAGDRADLLHLAVAVAARPPELGPAVFEALRARGISDEAILEAIQTAALTQLLCTLSTGLAVGEEFALSPAVEGAMPRAVPAAAGAPSSATRPPGTSVGAAALTPEAFAPFAFLKSRFGFVPAIFRAQTLKPETVDAEASAVREILLTEDVLTRRQKELVQLVVAAENVDAYGVALHTEVLKGLGMPPETSDALVCGEPVADLSEADAALLAFALRLAGQPDAYGEADVAELRSRGFSDAQIVEAVAATALAGFLSMLSLGLNPRPDFRPRRDLAAARTALATASAAARAAREDDPDSELVARAQRGDVAAFEDLVRRHQARIYRTLAGLTGNAEDAEDCCQSAFVNAFRKIGDFAGAARFSTWLTRIALNEGLERLRRTRPTESLDEPGGREEDYRPSDLAAWVEDPERLYAREETRRLVRHALARLPLSYRAAVMLRDLEQLSTAEAAAVLEIPVPTLKTRLLRGRLMLREALAAHFAAKEPAARRV